MKLTYYGHSCFAVQVANRTLLFDPFITGNELAKTVDTKEIAADYILISHAHDDHMGDAIDFAKRTGATVISNFEIVTWLEKKGLQKLHPMNHGGAFAFEFGKVKLVNAVHSSSLPDGAYGGNPCGLVISSAEGSFYYSGDTALTLDMKLIGDAFRLKFAALCIGDNFTMGAEDAVEAAKLVRCNQILGVHYDTFPPIKIDHQAAIETFKKAGMTLHLLKPAESRDF